MKTNIKPLLSLLLAVVFVFTLIGCAVAPAEDSSSVSTPAEESKIVKPLSAATKNLMADITAGKGDKKSADDQFISASANFAVELFKRSLSEKHDSSLISPLSVLLALSMTANGAVGETKAEMEAVFGLPIDELNAYLHAYLQNLPSADGYKLNIANSIWFTSDERFTVKEKFLQTNADYYGASAYRSAFDNQTLEDINNWIEQKTDGFIKQMLNEIPHDAVMYLINALVFDAKWNAEYKDEQISDQIFTSYKGEKRTVTMLRSEENILIDNNATGFIKEYKDGKYSFAALLPNEGVTIDEYIASLSGDKLMTMIREAKQRKHPNTNEVYLPEFNYDYDLSLNDVLKDMGMHKVFDSKLADLSELGNSTKGNLYVSRVLHKTFITVNRSGTQAGGATIIEVKDESYRPPIMLDRPFVYMIIDNTTNLPIFIGTVMDIAP